MSPRSSTAHLDAMTEQEKAIRQQTLADFAEWMRGLDYEYLAAIGVEMSVEEPLRLVAAFARQDAAAGGR